MEIEQLRYTDRSSIKILEYDALSLYYCALNSLKRINERIRIHFEDKRIGLRYKRTLNHVCIIGEEELRYPCPGTEVYSLTLVLE